MSNLIPYSLKNLDNTTINDVMKLIFKNIWMQLQIYFAKEVLLINVYHEVYSLASLIYTN